NGYGERARVGRDACELRPVVGQPPVQLEHRAARLVTEDRLAREIEPGVKSLFGEVRRRKDAREAGLAEQFADETEVTRRNQQIDVPGVLDRQIAIGKHGERAALQKDGG